MHRLKIYLLGPPQVMLDGVPIIAMRSDKVRGLLSYLAVEVEQPQRREKLAGLLWPDYPEASARSNLRRALADLRKVIDDSQATPPYINSTRQTIQFNNDSPAWVDVTAFTKFAQTSPTQNKPTIDHWEEACVLYKGAFMEGFSLPDSAPFEEWLRLNREHLQRLVLDTLYRAADSLGEQSEYEQALQYAWRQLEIDPLREKAQRQLMRLLTLDGQRDAALGQYENLKDLLASELGVEPSQDTIDLYGLLLKDENSLVTSLATRSSVRHAVDEREISSCPYRGLAAFQERDAPYFHGRENISAQLVEAVHQAPMIAVILGSSGSGKSSIAFAGLLPHLRARGDWLTADFRPGGRPFHSLAAALLPLLDPTLSEIDQLIESQKLADALSENSLILNQLLERILGKYERTKRLLLLVDQLEEVYTLSSDISVQKSFISRLLEPFEIGTSGYQPPVALVLTLRADFMGQALADREFADLLQNATIMIGPMSRTELRKAIELPAEKQEVAFEIGLVDRILDDVGDEPGNLPLLEFALTLLWAQAETGWLTHAGYEHIGRVEGALANYADTIYQDLDDADRAKTQRIFVQLVRPGDGTEDTRRIAKASEIGERDWPLTQYLADKRLVVTGRDVANNQTVELIHEALISHWQRLRDWIETDRAFRVWQERLRIGVRQWVNSNDDDGALLRGRLLVEAEAWYQDRESELSEDEQRFIYSSLTLREQRLKEQEVQRNQELENAQRLAQSEHRRRNILMALVGVLSIAILIAIVLSNIALRQRHAALEAYSLSLAANAQKALDDQDTATGLVLALAANQIDNPPREAQRVLLDAAYAPGAQKRHEINDLFSNVEGPATAIEISSDGRRVLAGFADGTLILWDRVSEEELARLSGHQGSINDIEFAPGSDNALSAGDNHSVIVWDTVSGEQIRRFNGHSGPVRTIDIDRTGHWAISGGYSGELWDSPGELILWDIESGEEIQRFDGHISGVVAAEFALDDQAILASSGDAELMTSIGSSTANSEQEISLDVLLWDIETGNVINDFPNKTHEAFSLSVSPDGTHALMGSYYEEIISLYNLHTGERSSILEGHDDAIRRVIYSNDGRSALSGSDDGTVILWNLMSAEPVFKVNVHSGEILDLAFSPDNKEALSSSSDNTLMSWTLTDEEELEQFSGHGDMVYDVSPTHDGKMLLSSSGSASISRLSNDTSIRLWSKDSHDQLGVLEMPPNPVIFQIAISPDDQTVLFVTNDPYVYVMDLASILTLASMEGHEGSVSCIEYLPDGERALSCSGDGTLILWDVESRTPIYRMDAHGGDQGLWSIAISPDGHSALSDTAEASMILWDLETGTELRRFVRGDNQGKMGASGIAFMPDGLSAISADSDGYLIQWDLENGAQIRRLGQHTALRTVITITPDGKLAVSAGYDGGLMVWDLETGELIRHTGGHGAIFDLAMSPDGDSVFFGSSDGLITKWRVSNPSQSELSEWIDENRFLRELTCYERGIYSIEPLCEDE